MFKTSFATISVGLVLATASCGSDGAVNGTAPPTLADADFSRPWVLKDRVASGKRIDTITLGSKGYVAITQSPSLSVGGKGVPVFSNVVAVSSDGVSWAERAIEPDGDYRSVTYGAGRYLAAGGQPLGGGRIVASADGWSWATVHETSAALRRIRHTEAGFIAVGTNGVVLTSRDGSTWIEAQEPARRQLEDGTFGAGRFVALGLTVSVGSPDGLSWSTLPCGPQLPCDTVTDPSGGGFVHLSSVQFGNGVFVAQGGGGGLLRSPDGLTWTRVGDTRSPLGFARGHFIALGPLQPGVANGSSFRVSVSGDGQSWAERTTAQVVQTDDTCATARCLLLPDALLLIPPAR